MDETEKELKFVGIGGLPRSGKDKLADLFMKSGYFGVSLGDIVRNVSRKRHADQADSISVDNMTETANWLRQTKGSDFALKEALDMYKKASENNEYEGLVVYSVRAPVEVDFILNHHGHLIWIETVDKVRHERAMRDLREGELPISLDEMLRQEAKQWQPQPDLPAEIQMNIAYVKEHATNQFENNSNDMDEFNKKGQVLIDQL